MNKHEAIARARQEINRMKEYKDRWNPGYDLVGWFVQECHRSNIEGAVYLTQYECDTDPYGTMKHVSHVFDIGSPEALTLVAAKYAA